MDIATYAATYLAAHPESDYWNTLAAAARTACLNLAADDIAVRLGRTAPDPESVPQLKAVCEQAVYLARYYEKLNLPFDVTSEEIYQVGKRSFRRNAAPELARRARMFLRQAVGRETALSRG
ncbi:MAG: hypothetical protein PHQ27_03050 [Victivallales bacterium]|nr:hypothetical protein [Victivallales bacterium]